jgi:hypothetical protein
LVGHGFPLLVLQGDVSFRGVKASDITGERHDLDAVQLTVRGVVADNHRGPRLADFPTSGRIESDPPYLAALGGLLSGAWIIGYVARQILQPFRRFALAFLVGRHGAVCLRQLALGHMRARKFVEEPPYAARDQRG